MPFPLLADDRERLRNLRRQFHADPELSFDETRTAERVRNELKDIGLHAKAVTETGGVALLDTGRPGRTILIRADMDALPVQELNEHEYCSQNPGKMHACGHDGHTAILLLVARLLHRHQEELVGRFLFVFQPAEEIGAGAPAMIEAGLLDSYKPDGCIGLHLWSQTPTGDILITEGPFMASMDRFVVTVKGQGGHGAIPQHARDPIVAAAHMIVALQTTVSRTTDPLEGAVVTVGTVQGGHAFNV